AISCVIFMIALVIPPIIIAAFDLPEIFYAYFNPVAYITTMGEIYTQAYPASPEYSLLINPILVTVALLVTIGLFIWRHYTIRKIVRHRMEL
ncbi:MAG: hypothetical protein AB1599_10415, partial [Planctomycetota bacterium]